MHTAKWQSLISRTLGRELGRVLVGVAACAGALAACSSDHPSAATEQVAPVTVGNMHLALQGVGASGTVYRVRDGIFTITNLNTGVQTSVSSETDPYSWYIDVNLPAGDYAVYLEPGYRIEASSTYYVPIAASADAAASTAVPVDLAAPTDRGWLRSAATERSPLFRAKRRAGGLGSPTSLDAGGPLPTTTPSTLPPTVVDGGVIAPPASDAGAFGWQLLSYNPQYVTVYANGYSSVYFTFLINGTGVTTGDGTLEIGVDFQEVFSCPGEDSYEPNDDRYSAAHISSSGVTSAFSCLNDVDYFVFDSPVPAGEMFSVQLTFDGNVSDIDMDVGRPDGTYVGGSYGLGDTESVTVVSDGGSYVLETYNLGPYSQDYTIGFSSVIPGANQCCDTSSAPGCNDAAVQDCVCANDPFCCAVAWDSICVQEAARCGTTCGGGGNGSCCSSSSEAGCNEPAVVQCVCAMDAACCASGFDDLCVQEALANCSPQCAGATAPTSNCCTAAAEPGCTDQGIEACVCGIDPTCCTSGYDDNCAALAQGQCGATCVGADQ